MSDILVSLSNDVFDNTNGTSNVKRLSRAVIGEKHQLYFRLTSVLSKTSLA